MAERGARLWLGLSAVAAAGSALGLALPAGLIDWQPALAWHEPWRWWTAAFVHWSPMHLTAGLAGCAVVAAYGVAARVPVHAVAAWLLAWPLTHLALLAQPALVHYGGLSGVLHAGVAAASVPLLARPGRARLVGAVVLAGLALKLVLERPWAGPVSQPAGWDIAVAPLAHASGALAGLLGTLVLLTLRARR